METSVVDDQTEDADRSAGVDSDRISSIVEHFTPLAPALVGDGPLLEQGYVDTIDVLLNRCPVTHTDQQFIGSPTGSWVVSRHDDVSAILKDPYLFSSRARRGARDERPLIPFEIDPPELLSYRRLLQPFFTVRQAESFADTARALVTKHLDRFVATGRCDDIVDTFARPLASEIQWRWLVGLDELDHAQLLEWMTIWLYKHFEPEFADAEKEWVQWIQDTVDARRAEPRREDLIDTLLHGEMDGRRLTDDEIIGVILLLIIGGVPAVTDAISNLVLRLAVYPDLQDRLRNDPALIPRAIEESLRLEPSSTGGFRRCTRDTEIGGEKIRAEENIFWYIAAANRDPDVFERPNEFDLERDSGAHLAFGTGHHRCLGVSVARQILRVVFEELLARTSDIRLVPDDPPSRVPALSWGVHHLPVQFRPAGLASTDQAQAAAGGSNGGV